MIDMIRKVFDAGCNVSVCPPCAKVRGYSEESLLDGVNIVGSIAIHERVLEGAAVLTF